MSETIKNVFSNLTGPYSSSTQVETSDTGFLNSNGLVAKIVFLIMVIIIFIVLFYLVIRMISYFTTPSDNPIIINGELDGTKTMVIPQNPALKDSKLIARSNNESAGLEFTWSVWLKASRTMVSTDRFPVFIKGDGTATTVGTVNYKSLNHGPGVYFYVDSPPTSTNPQLSLEILMDTIEELGTMDPIKIKNVPLEQYFNLVIRCKGVYVDIYMNGTVIQRKKLKNVPKQNYYNIQVCPSGGFQGKLSNLRYFNRGLSVIEINSIYRNGPNTTPIMTESSSAYSYSILSTSWYNSFIQ